MKKLYSLILAALLAVTVMVIPAEAVSAKTYCFDSNHTKTFLLKKGKLTIKTTGKKYGVGTYDQESGTIKKSKTSYTVRVDKNCKWRVEIVDRRYISSEIHKSSYKKIKGYIANDYKYKCNLAYSELVVKNGKITKVTYVSM